MAQQKLASMSIDALLKLRDDVASALTNKAKALKDELLRIMPNGADEAKQSRARRPYKKSAVKYRDPKTGETWAGRGATATWIVAHEKAGRNREQFLVDKSTAKKAKKKKKRKAK